MQRVTKKVASLLHIIHFSAPFLLICKNTAYTVFKAIKYKRNTFYFHCKSRYSGNYILEGNHQYVLHSLLFNSRCMNQQRGVCVSYFVIFTEKLIWSIVISIFLFILPDTLLIMEKLSIRVCNATHFPSNKRMMTHVCHKVTQYFLPSFTLGFQQATCYEIIVSLKWVKIAML